MNRQFWLILSLGLNLLLAGVVIWARQRGVSPEAPPPMGSLTNRPLRLPPPSLNPDPELVAIAASFHWAQLESEDYRVYIENLRAIGCPEETIRYLVEADINDLYSGRVRTLVNSVTDRFWELMLRQKEFEQTLSEKQKELETLQKERRELLDLLFDEREPAALAAQRAEALANLKEQYEFLSEEKLAGLKEIDDAFQKSVAAWAGQPLSAAERSQKQAELNAQKEAQLKALLSDSELAEYTLRTGAAGNLRYELLDVEVTEAEARALALAKSQPNGTDQIKELLGPDRYAAYQRAQDEGYRQTLRVTDRFDLPSETAVQVYQLRKEAEAQAGRIRRDQNRPGEERLAILQAMQAETEKSIAAVLGPKIFKAYQKHGGDWLSRFSDKIE
jgi:hypothetical protein